MRLCSIASGSSGNCIYVGDDKTHILVDTGISKKRVELGLSELEINGEDIDGILITHEHIDHIGGLGVFSRKYNVPIYATEGTIRGILDCKSVGNINNDLFNSIKTNETFSIGSLEIHSFDISHDANEPSAYRIESGDKAVAVATDLGMYDEYIVDRLQNLNALVLEANHDLKMLEVGPYPYPLKQRVSGNYGHLSNEVSGRLLCEIINDRLQCVVLGHLSKENNHPALAYETVKLEVALGNVVEKLKKIPIKVANRDCVSEIIVI